MIIASVATVIATLLGALASIGLTRRHCPGRGIITAFLLTPMIVQVIITGVGPWFAFRTVTMPQIAPSIISGALFAFITSFGEVTAALFIAGIEQYTLPRQMFSGIRENLDPTIAAVATVMIVVSLIILGFAQFAAARSKKNR